jgi:hypothetical protein
MCAIAHIGRQQLGLLSRLAVPKRRKAGRAHQDHCEHPLAALKFEHNLRVWRAENARLDDISGHAHAIEAIHPHELVTALHPPIIR